MAFKLSDYENKLEKSTNPSSTDDNYKIGTVWVNTSTDVVFICVDNTASTAVWVEVGDVSTDGTLSGNSDSVVPTEKAVKTYVDANSGGSGSITWTDTTTDTTATAGSNHFLSTGITLTLPSSPSFGNMVRVLPGGDWSTTNSTVSGNGEKINGSSSTFTLNSNLGITFVYKNTSWGWAIGQ